jgi:hypothetical protein
VAEQLRKSVLALYDKHLAADGKAVDYKGLAADPGFRLFVDATAELQKLDVSGFSREQRMAFWINIYNILVVSYTPARTNCLHLPRCIAPLPAQYHDIFRLRHLAEASQAFQERVHCNSSQDQSCKG